MKKTTSITVKLADPTYNRTAGPPESAMTDHELHLKLMEQEALADYNSGEFDIVTVQGMQKEYLPGERKARAWLKTETERATAARNAAESVANTLDVTAPVDLIANGPTLPRDHHTTIKDEEAAVEQINKDITAAEKKREQFVSVTEGKSRNTTDGIVWSGEAPSKPGPDTTKRQVRFSDANIKAKALQWVPYLVLGVVEALIIITTLKAYLRDDDWIAPAALAVAFLAGLLFLPSTIGRTLATMYRRGFAMAKEVAALVFETLGWLLSVGATVYFRVTADQQDAIRKAASAQEIPIDQVDPAVVYNVPLHALSWLVPVGLIGFVVILAHLWWHNPVIAQIIDGDYALVDLYSSRTLHSTVLEKGRAIVKATKEANEASVKAWEHHRDHVLPVQEAECEEHYRAWLSRYFGNPGMTDAIYGRGI